MTGERLASARLARSHASRRRTLDRTGSGHSARERELVLLPRSRPPQSPLRLASRLANHRLPDAERSGDAASHGFQSGRRVDGASAPFSSPVL